MEQNQLTPDERKALSYYTSVDLALLTFDELDHFSFLLKKHLLAEKAQCLTN